ncbi:ABC transporter ATP-binding protein [Streptomyces sp. NPDC059639]|uniref:ABC transporter ATP-binding protein n=1 Tax=Streptomyces sp. NPDC059639 TaxID=3346891 RepID=UPI0036B5DDFD
MTSGKQAGHEWLRRFAALCWARPRAVTLACLGAVAGVLLTTTAPLIIRRVVDGVIVAGRDAAAPWITLLLAVAAAQFGASWVRRWWAGKVQWGVERDLRLMLHDAIQRIDGRRLDRLRSGDVLSRAVNDVAVVRDLTGSLPLLAQNGLTLLLTLGVMLTLSPLLACVALAVVPPMMLLARHSRDRIYPADRAVQERTGEASEAVESNIAGVRVVKGFAQEDAETDRYAGLARRLFAARVHRRYVAARYAGLLGELLPGTARFGVVLLGGWLAVRGDITLGTFVAFTTYLAAMMGPVRMLSTMVGQAQEARSGLVRIFELADAEQEVTERPDAVAVGDGPLAVVFDRVTFAHEPGASGAAPALDGLDLTIAPGETLALVGGSGSGKSTVGALLSRLYDADAGAVRIGPAGALTDVTALRLDSLRDAVGIAFEESLLFSESVRDTIRFGRPDATDDEVHAAAGAAQADAFVRALPDGYDTVLGAQGLTLSGGQRQRLALARALLTDPRILVLDDATSAVDPKVEAAILASLRTQLAGRTVLLVAHRRSTLRLADRIAVLEAGRVLDTGTHDELTARCPRYRELMLGELEDLGDLGDLGELEEFGELEEPAREAGDGPVVGGALPADPLPSSDRPAPDAVPTRDPDVDEARARAADPDFTLRRLLRPYRARLLAIGVLLVADTALLMLAPRLVSAAIDLGVRRHDGAALTAVAGGLLATAVANWLVFAYEMRAIARTGERILYELRVKMFAHLQRLGLDYFERESGGAAVTRMVSDVAAIGEFVQSGLLDSAVSVMLFTGVLALMFALDTGLALTVLVVVPVLAVACWWYGRVSKRRYDRARTQLGGLNSAFQEAIDGVRVTQAYRRQDRSAARFHVLAEEQRLLQMRSQRSLAWFFSAVEFLSDATTALILGVGAWRVADGAASTGTVVAFLLYVGLVFGPIRNASQLLDGYQRARVGLGRCRELLRERPTVTEPHRPLPLPAFGSAGRMRGEVVLKDLHYAYEGGGKRALDGVSARIGAGETVAVVGTTGAGKSTLLKLIARMYLPTGGAVEIDSVDLRAMDGFAYRSRIGLVPQEAYLFGGTVREAIAYGRPGASDAEVRAAVEEVGAHRMIAGLPQGYGHRLTERGRNLSAGQRQLIALARARLIRPDLMLLDEATAALDLATEAAVGRAVEAATAAPTTIVVAHRLTTAARADRVLVLEGGRLVEDGPHEALVAAGGHYAALWSAYDDGVIPA